MPFHQPFTLEPLTSAHLGEALELCRAAGWNQLRADWQRLVDYEPDGCWMARCDGRLAGTVTTTRYGRQLAWIGMMLVHPDFRRRGLASLLIRHSLDYLTDCQVQCVKLDATPTGEQVYRKLGFEVEWRFHRWSRDGRSQPPEPSRDMTSPSLAESALAESALAESALAESALAESPLSESILEVDQRAFGADRSRLLEMLGRSSTVRTGAGGFGMLRPGKLASYLGPISAESPEEAKRLVVELSRFTDGRIFWDVPETNPEAVAVARSLGFTPVRDLARMWYGQTCLQPDLQRQFALAGPATG